MKKTISIVLIGLVTILLAACGSVTLSTPTVTSFPTNTPVSSFTLLPTTPTALPANTPVPSVTPTLAGPSVEFEQPAFWTFKDPKNPSLPELIIPGEQGFQLDPNWRVDYVVYTFELAGLDTFDSGLEALKPDGSDYLWVENEKKISAEKMKKFLSSLTNLHLVHSPLTGNFHTDDYSKWQLTLEDANKNEIYLYAASNENAGYGPWHVIYNGRIYAQYDGQIGLAVGSMFDGLGGPFVWPNPYAGPEHPANVVAFDTSAKWLDNPPYTFQGIPASEEMQAAMENNPNTKDLLKDHRFYDARYIGKIELGRDKTPSIIGVMVLAGQAYVSGYHVRYTVAVPFGIIDSKFVDWGLTRQELRRLISDAFNSPVTQRVYKQFPATTLNLWYVTREKSDYFPEIPQFIVSSSPSYFGVSLPACNKIPALAFPNAQQPLRAFGFNSDDADSFSSSSTTFVLTNTEAVLYNLDLYMDIQDDELSPFLAPRELIHDGEIPFKRVYYYFYYDDGSRLLKLEPDSKASGWASFIMASAPFNKLKKMDGSFRNTGMIINDDGSLSIVDCSTK